MEAKSHPRPVLPLLALLLLASALGIAAAIVLAGVAMLLAAPAYADEGRCSLLNGTQMTSARVVEAYRNPFDEPLAGVYVHVAPEGVAPVHAALVERADEIEVRCCSPS